MSQPVDSESSQNQFRLKPFIQSLLWHSLPNQRMSCLNHFRQIKFSQSQSMSSQSVPFRIYVQSEAVQSRGCPVIVCPVRVCTVRGSAVRVCPANSICLVTSLSSQSHITSIRPVSRNLSSLGLLVKPIYLLKLF